MRATRLRARCTDAAGQVFSVFYMVYMVKEQMMYSEWAAGLPGLVLLSPQQLPAQPLTS